MNKLLNLLFLFFFPSLLIAQNLSEYATLSFPDSSAKKHTLIVNADGYVASNSLKSNLFNKFLWGGNISSELKEETSNLLKSSNLVGVNAQGSIAFVSDESDRFGKGTSLILAYKQTLFNDIKVNKAIPDMLFNGNNKYLGTSISLNNTALNLLNYGSLSVGILKTITRKTDVHTFGFSMGYALGFSNTSLNMSSGQLKFASDGSSIDLNGIYQLSITDTTKSKILNGNGWVSSFFYQFTKPSKYSVRFFIEDFGQLFWKKESLSGQKNSAIHFEGFQISDLINVNSDEINHAKDSLINSLYYPSKAQAYHTFTPCKIGIGGEYYLSDKITISVAIWQYANTNQRVGYLIKPIFSRVFKTIEIAPFLMSNGYSPLDFGVEFGIKSIKNTIIKANLNAIPLNSHTLGGSVMIGYRF